MKITAVIPCYNGEKYIDGAIRSLLNQTRPPDEIIIVDDGSTDRSPDIIQNYPGIKLIRHSENLGLPAGRNNAWKAAEGDVIAYIDVDAYAQPTFIEKIAASYTDDDIAAVGGAGYEYYGEPAPNRWRQKFLSQNHGTATRDDITFLFGIGASFRKRVLAEIGGFDPLFRTNGEDVDVCLRIRKKGYRILYCPEAVLIHHRQDTWMSLCKMIYRWWKWGHIAHIKNQVPYLMEHIKITWKMMWCLIRTTVRELKPRLFLISIFFFFIAHKAILDARCEAKSILKG